MQHNVIKTLELQLEYLRKIFYRMLYRDIY